MTASLTAPGRESGVAWPAFPTAFRRRLTLAFVIVAAAASGLLAAGSYAVVREYRTEAFSRRAMHEAAIAGSVLERLNEFDLRTFTAAYVDVDGTEVVAERAGQIVSSDASFTASDIPARIRSEDGATDIVNNGRRYLVVARSPGLSNTKLYFFFDRGALDESLDELRAILGLGWVGVTGAAFLVGRSVARRTLKPVASAASAAHSIAEGLLDTRLPPGRADEFGTFARAFNEMTQELAAKLEELAAANERERRFTGDVAHELLTPLGAMVTEASVLAEFAPELPHPAGRMATLLAEDVQRLRRLVEQLLELSRLDAAVPEPGPVIDVAARVREITTRFPGVSVKVDAEEPVLARADPNCLDGVIVNLLTNAERHGEPPVVVRVGSDDCVVISVRDHGQGIPEGQADALYDRFFKADTARSSEGYGLGLAIAAQRTRVMGGRISATNAEDGGAIFELRIPKP